MTSVLLRFPGDRTAAFQCSFGAAPVGSYDLVGTRGSLCMNPAFEIAEDLVQYLTVGDKTRTRVYPARDQFAPELLEFSDCILSDREPEPSGEEGLADVRVLEAIEESARQGGRPVRLARFEKEQRPSLKQEIQRPLPPKPELVRVEPPSA
jgi:glucose-fructose oxidoreductase